MNERPPNRVPRRWFRFSLRTLFLLVTVLGVWLGLHMQAARRQKESIAAIKDLGGWCYYDYQDRYAQELEPDLTATSPVPSWLHDWLGDDFFHNVIDVDMMRHYDSQGKVQENKRGTGDDLKYLAAFPKLKMLSLTDKQASNAGLAYVGKLSRLEGLYLVECGDIGDEGVAHLTGLRRLKEIHINNAQITDESLKVLATMPSLEGLYLQANQFTTRGLAYLGQMVQLKYLAIGMGDASGITDDGLVQLKGLVNLESLDLQGISITAAGLEHLKGLKNLKALDTDVLDVSDLQAALPNCKIDHPVSYQIETPDE